MKDFHSIEAFWAPWMRRALQLADLAQGDTSPNPLVGALVLDLNDRLVGEGFHSRAGEPHAEILALRQAGLKANKGTLVVTLEPCCHFGLTPPCVEEVLRAGISRVVVASQDPDPRVAGKGLQSLRASGVEVISGVLEREAAFQNRAFNFRVKTGRPWGILKWAMSLDGRTALSNGQSKWISGQNARNWVHRLRAGSDAVIVGGQTLRTDNPLLTSRGLSTPEPFRVVMTRKMDLPSKAILWDTSVARTFVAFEACSKDDASEKLPIGIESIELESSEPLFLLEDLAKKGCNKVLWECGPRLASAAINQGCVQELAVMVAPKILGGVPERTPLADLGFTSMDDVISFDRFSLEKHGNDLLINVPLPPN